MVNATGSPHRSDRIRIGAWLINADSAAKLLRQWKSRDAFVIRDNWCPHVDIRVAGAAVNLQDSSRECVGQPKGEISVVMYRCGESLPVGPYSD
jgi:hypothetical protein